MECELGGDCTGIGGGLDLTYEEGMGGGVDWGMIGPDIVMPIGSSGILAPSPDRIFSNCCLISRKH